jgi:excinuclease ABC subunit C
MENFRQLEKKNIAKLPKTAGVYAFFNGKKILYIGKAANIKERVKNHFQQPSYRDNLFVDKVKKIGYVETNSEIKALILEAELIKKYQPNYNVVWKDDKNYFYIGITKEDFPRIFITHQTKNVRGSTSNIYIGPFVDGKSLKETLKILRKVFPYRSCKTMPKSPCLWYQLDRCPAPCLFKSNLGKQIDEGRTSVKFKKEYSRDIKNLTGIFQKGKAKAENDLEKEMKNLAKQEKFEEAEKIKQQLYSLKRILSHAKVFNMTEVSPLSFEDWPYQRAEAYDIANIQGQEATGSMVVFINGQADKSQYRKFKIKSGNTPNDIAMLKEVLQRRLNHKEWPYPDLILIDGGKAQFNIAKKVCSQLKIKNVKITAIAKKHNELFVENRKKPILLKTMPRQTFNIVLQMRDEAHRFAQSYHHKLRETDLKILNNQKK